MPTKLLLVLGPTASAPSMIDTLFTQLLEGHKCTVFENALSLDEIHWNSQLAETVLATNCINAVRMVTSGLQSTIYDQYFYFKYISPGTAGGWRSIHPRLGQTAPG